MLSCALPFLMEQQTGNRNANMTQVLLACRFAKCYCTCMCIQYIIMKAV